MEKRAEKTLRIAILDLYEGQPNEGMRCIRDILTQFGKTHEIALSRDEWEVRLGKKLPGLDYDAYISSGGPGSPLESAGNEWEKLYFNWLDGVLAYNNDPARQPKKPVLFICHSFQLACRHFGIATVAKRKSTAFGVFPVHMVPMGKKEPVFRDLRDPFYAVDSRDYQVIQPDHKKLQKAGGAILAIEKERPHVPLERAVMAARFNAYMIGTQFHPEADGPGMSMYLQREDKKRTVIENHGYEKWKSMVSRLSDPDKILWTYGHVIPNFLEQVLEQVGKPRFSLTSLT